MLFGGKNRQSSYVVNGSILWLLPSSNRYNVFFYRDHCGIFEFIHPMILPDVRQHTHSQRLNIWRAFKFVDVFNFFSLFLLLPLLFQWMLETWYYANNTPCATTCLNKKNSKRSKFYTAFFSHHSFLTIYIFGVLVCRFKMSIYSFSIVGWFMYLLNHNFSCYPAN